eukprot:7206515-Alexandrium_andersonii.AAC.1
MTGSAMSSRGPKPCAEDGVPTAKIGPSSLGKPPKPARRAVLGPLRGSSGARGKAGVVGKIGAPRGARLSARLGPGRDA